MNFYSRFIRKNDSKHDPKGILVGCATVEVPSSQTDRKDHDAKPSIEPSSILGMAKNNWQQAHPEAETGKQATRNAISEDKAASEAMLSEGGHASPGNTPGAIREPDAAIVAETELQPDPTDGANPGLSVKSDL